MVALEEKINRTDGRKKRKGDSAQSSSSFVVVLRSRCFELGSRVHQVSDWCTIDPLSLTGPLGNPIKSFRPAVTVSNEKSSGFWPETAEAVRCADLWFG
jgi:hypothetical protein